MRLIVFCLLIIFANISLGQGCSDAGFCTIDSFKPNSDDSSQVLNNQFKIGTFFGSADKSISVYGLYVEYNRQINEKIGLDLKLTSIAQNGNDISVFGLSDVFLNANYKPSKKLTLTLGAKVPLTNASKSLNGTPLPMDYQSSLGTFDLVFGIGYEIKKLQLVAAIQQPLTQNNNQFFADLYPEDSELRQFQSTNKFKRSGDIMLRISYPINLVQKLNLNLSVLSIYHLTNDKYTNELDIEEEIIGSEGFTLNGNIYLDYAINKRNILQFNMGAPFIVRESRPDGLTRSFIANLEYRFKF